MDLWHDIAPGRGEGALSWTALRDFREITGRRVEPDMARALIAVDRVYLSESSKAG